MPLCKNEDLIIPREVERLREFQDLTQRSEGQDNVSRPRTISHDTVGAVALDSAGNIAAATSTGGTLNKAPGRLGDSSLIGCGCYADNESAAVSITGWGEPIMKLVSPNGPRTEWPQEIFPSGPPRSDELFEGSRKRPRRHHRTRLPGRFGLAHNTPRMAWAYRTISKQEAGVIREV